MLAYLLIGRACRPDIPPDARDLYGAQIGVALAFVSLAHVTGGWKTINY